MSGNVNPDRRPLWERYVEWDWVITPEGWRLQHVAHIPDPEQVEQDWGGTGVTTCGRTVDARIPGLLDRMGLDRCAHCCDRLGWPRGTGSPKNDDALRPLVEARLAPTDSAVHTETEP